MTCRQDLTSRTAAYTVIFIIRTFTLSSIALAGCIIIMSVGGHASAMVEHYRIRYSEIRSGNTIETKPRRRLALRGAVLSRRAVEPECGLIFKGRLKFALCGSSLAYDKSARYFCPSHHVGVLSRLCPLPAQVIHGPSNISLHYKRLKNPWSHSCHPLTIRKSQFRI